MNDTPPRSPLLGASSTIAQLRHTISRIAKSPLAVLVYGPAGAGKEVIAEAIHLESGRSGRFVSCNVSGIAETMFEDALFGHVRGAFTNAITTTKGYLLEANNGTLFMDEVGQLRLSGQSTLLRALETRAFRPVGANADSNSEFRLVSATNENLTVLIDEKRFREDLFHRIGAYIIEVPPLRAHAEDIPLLAYHFLSQVSSGDTWDLTEPALRMLQSYDWPGNIRQLRSTIHAARYLSGETIIDREAIVEALRLDDRKVSRHGNEVPVVRVELMVCLQECNNDLDVVARRYGVAKGTVYRWLRDCHIPTPVRKRSRTSCPSVVIHPMP